MPLDFDENTQSKVRSTSFYHETEGGMNNDGSTGAGPIDKGRRESFFYYSSTVEVDTTMADLSI